MGVLRDKLSTQVSAFPLSPFPICFLALPELPFFFATPSLRPFLRDVEFRLFPLLSQRAKFFDAIGGSCQGAKIDRLISSWSL